MFIKVSRSGYTRNGEQSTSGAFLMVFSHNSFKWADEMGEDWRSTKASNGRVLYGIVRHVTLKQFGAWMMGTARIAGQSVTVSGAYGGDGLPSDYESLTPAARTKLVRLPPELTETFWNGGGHNSAGSEAPAMRKWALENYETLTA